MATDGLRAGLAALVCPYCGAALIINTETVGPAYLTYEPPESIECQAGDCEAVWEPNGEPRDAPRWVRYPDLYPKPDRAHPAETAGERETDGLSEAVVRVNEWIRQRRMTRGLDVNVINNTWTDVDASQAELRLDDLAAITAALAARAGGAGVGE